ncbi:nuclease sbcCD subunit C [Peptoclostridium acidaminophilum DSM 3953]|uniref:Nuclease SbcCD subunit C n=1 Tax=Peptoclostridium acidaminophilum DSM 3953 TaxID=1286171 RepID=W8T5M4_PEPAC|nr:SMC family ATPase [Peptoclostridium acidaminophilum]AHM56130.1 nuclease sbcCD subunit C [Peptoclostridium acidaminophilum DSM 3953]
MRPIRLVMSAFGPYAGEETLDFRNLKDNNIFLITGPTGAGKTTIFDAISYALFGEASGSSRDKSDLRSDFAQADTPTYVELEFELRGKSFQIKRYPQQEKKKSRGEGYTMKEASAELVLPDGSVVTRINSVDEKIGEILGISRNQFRQVVMLPQGEFRKLIESESREREEIFRKIFGTQAFETIQKILQENRKQLRMAISDAKSKLETNVRRIDPEGDEALAVLIESGELNVGEILTRSRMLIKSDEELQAALSKRLEQSRLNQEKLQKTMIEAVEVNKKLRERDSAGEKLAGLESRKKEYEGKAYRLAMGRKALEISIVDESVKEKFFLLDSKKAEYIQLAKRLEFCEKELKISQETLILEEGRAHERKATAEDITRLGGFVQKVKEYEEKQKAIKLIKDALSGKQKELESLKSELEINKASQKKQTEELRLSNEAQIQKEKFEKQLHEKELLLSRLRTFYGTLDKLAAEQIRHLILEKEYEAFEKTFLAAKASYEKIEDMFRKGQAGLLARSLEEGSPCPVCGSKNHPLPALLIEGMPTEEVLRRAQEAYENVKLERDKRLQDMAALNGSIKSIRDSVSEQKESLKPELGEELTVIQDDALQEYLEKQGKELRYKFDELKKSHEGLERLAKSKEAIEESIKRLGVSIEEKEKMHGKLEEDKNELQMRRKGEEGVLESIENEIPPQLRSLDRLSEKNKALEEKLRAMEKDLDKARESHSKAQLDKAKIEKEKEAAAKASAESEKEIEALKARMEEMLLAAGFKDYSHYEAQKMSKQDIEETDGEINKYYQELKSAADRLEKAQVEAEGLLKISIEGTEEELAGVKQLCDELDAIIKKVYARQDGNLKALSEMERIVCEIERQEEHFSVAGELASIANGDNPERLTFERYVLAAYFDEIIKAANARLAKMAQGRFLLMRKDERGKGRKQEGLELEVFDNYTGKARHVKSLSGGEGFKASLSLALGMADIVQSYTGGVSLDTIFIDEGFGSLDPESLDSAVECLVDLQESGRLVGIISHVPELKESINARLEITASKNGSKASFAM